jgi:hypothetical protein
MHRERSKSTWLLLAAATALAHGQPWAIPPPDRDPFVGEWKANADASHPRLHKRERPYERTIARDGDDLVFASSGGASKATVRQFRIRCDGIFHPLPSGHVLACRYAPPNRVEGETKDYSTGEDDFWAREVSADGQRMSILGYKDKARTMLRSIEVLDRVR